MGKRRATSKDPEMLVNVLRLLERREAMPLTARGNPEAKPQSRATVGSRAAGLTLDGGENGGNSGLSADAVTLCLRVFKHLTSRGWQLDLLC
jgi:hypothetical protein